MSIKTFDYSWKVSRARASKLSTSNDRAWSHYEIVTPHGIATAYAEAGLAAISFVYRGRMYRRSIEGPLTEAGVKRKAIAFVRDVVAGGAQ